jgi:uncharacterized protein (DUF433 family)
MGMGARSDKGKLEAAAIKVPFELECVVGNDYCTSVIATSYRYIVQRLGVRSGHPIVEGTRIGVHDVVAMTKTGASVDQVVASFPKLTRAQVYECLAYYEDHQRDLDPLIAAQIVPLDG